MSKDQPSASAVRAKKWREEHPGANSAYSKEYAKTHREEAKVRKARWIKSNPGNHGSTERKNQWRKDHPEWSKKASRKHSLKHKYSMTMEQFEELFDAQGGVCAICGKPELVTGRTLAVDHDHISGHVRGLLCSRCNLVLGLIGDSTEILSASIQYLKNRAATNTISLKAVFI